MEPYQILSALLTEDNYESLSYQWINAIIYFSFILYSTKLGVPKVKI